MTNMRYVYMYLYLYLHLYRLELRAVEQLDIWIGTHGNSPSPLQYIQNSEYIVQLWYWSFNSLEFHCPWSRLFHRNVLTPFESFLSSHNFIFLFLHVSFHQTHYHHNHHHQHCHHKIQMNWKLDKIKLETNQIKSKNQSKLTFSWTWFSK